MKEVRHSRFKTSVNLKYILQFGKLFNLEHYFFNKVPKYFLVTSEKGNSSMMLDKPTQPLIFKLSLCVLST